MIPIFAGRTGAVGVVIAITLHNFPEGMAVGVGFAGGDMGNGAGLATGIGIQNIPEVLAVSVSLMSIGYSRSRACMIGLLTGLAEPIGGAFGAMAVSVAPAPCGGLRYPFCGGYCPRNAPNLSSHH